MLTLGVDPGVSGALALLDGDELAMVYDMPTMADGKRRQVNAAALANILRQHAPDRAIVEKVASMPGQGVASTFAFGKSFGVVLGVVAAMGCPLHLVTPQAWKRHYRLVGKDKDQARTLAQELYPRASLARKKDVGRADAILIALYAARGAAL